MLDPGPNPVPEPECIPVPLMKKVTAPMVTVPVPLRKKVAVPMVAVQAPVPQHCKALCNAAANLTTHYSLCSKQNATRISLF
jgi:hypothetical protein